MKKKKDLKPVIICVLIIILFVIIYFSLKENESVNNDINIKTDTSNDEENENIEISEVEAEIKTITNTLSSSGEIKTGLDEKITLHASYYLEEIYVEEGDKVLKGEKILKYTNGEYLTAPYNLIISQINVPKISSICTNSNYIEVYSIDTLEILLSIDEDDLNKISVGKEVEITPSVDSSKTYTGYITKISNQGTYSSRGTTYEVEVTFGNNGELKVGMSATAEIILEKAENVIVIPNEAIEEDDSKKYVTVVKDGKTTQIEVEVGITNDAYTEIKSGLSEGDIVQIKKEESTTENRMDFMKNNGDMRQAGDMQERKNDDNDMVKDNFPENKVDE